MRLAEVRLKMRVSGDRADSSDVRGRSGPLVTVWLRVTLKSVKAASVRRWWYVALVRGGLRREQGSDGRASA